MKALVEQFLGTELFNGLQMFAGSTWMQITTFANDIARSGPILDLAGITLCVIVIAYLVYNRIKYRQLLLDDRLITSNRTDFSAEVITRMIGQQTEKSFATLARAIYNERERLQNWAEKSLLPAGETLFVSEKPVSQDSLETTDFTCTESAESRYLEISKLAAAGMGIGEIATVVKRPQAEIELYLSLERRKVANGDESGTENIAPRGKNFRLISGNRLDAQV